MGKKQKHVVSDLDQFLQHCKASGKRSASQDAAYKAHLRRAALRDGTPMPAQHEETQTSLPTDTAEVELWEDF